MTVYFINIISLFLDPALYYSIYFSVGDSRSCDVAFFPGNDYLDKLEREEEISFDVVDSEFSDFVEFDRDSSWIFIADDDSKGCM